MFSLDHFKALSCALLSSLACLIYLKIVGLNDVNCLQHDMS